MNATLVRTMWQRAAAEASALQLVLAMSTFQMKQS